MCLLLTEPHLDRFRLKLHFDLENYSSTIPGTRLITPPGYNCSGPAEPDVVCVMDPFMRHLATSRTVTTLGFPELDA